MNAGLLFQVVQFVVMTMAAVLLWSIRLAFKGGYASKGVDSRMADVEREVKEHARRMDKHGLEYSQLFTKVQALPETLRTMFVPREIAAEWLDESRRDRAKLHQDFEELRRRLDDAR